MSKPQIPHRPCRSPTFLDGSFRSIAQEYKEKFIILGLLGGLYGVLTILSIISCYALLTRRSGRIQLTTTVLCLTILALFTSTTAYVVIRFIYLRLYLMVDLVLAPESLWSIAGSCLPHSKDASGLLHVLIKRMPVEACASTVTLTVNVILGDAIVCWRACVIWHNNYIVKAICGVFLLATLVLGAIDAHQSCQPPKSTLYITSGDAALGIGLSAIPGVLLEGIPIGIATCVFSFSLNTLATLLVAYKAWQSRRDLKRYLLAKTGGSRVEKVLALLIESGMFYSAIWLVVVAFQIINISSSIAFLQTSMEVLRLRVFSGYIAMNGALVPAIAIYPVIIIVLVALNRSHMERGISQHLESIPTLRFAIPMSTITASIHTSHSHPRSEVLALEGQELGSGGDLEDARRYTRKESRAEGIASV